jgi:hypothetical protein
VAYGGRSEASLADRIRGDQLKLRAGSYDSCHTCIGQELHQPPSGDKSCAMPFANSLPPMPLARCSIEATGDSRVRHGQEVIIYCNWRRNIWGRLAVAPRNVRLRHVAMTVWSNREHRAIGICRAEQQQPGLEYRRRDRSPLRPFGPAVYQCFEPSLGS